MHGTGTGHRIRVTFVRSLRAQALVAVLLPVVVVVGNLAAATWFDHVNHRAQSQELAAQQALVATTTAQATLLDAEADTGAYLLTGSTGAHQRFEKVVAALPGELRAVATVAPATGPLHLDVVRARTDLTALERVMDQLVAGPVGPSPSTSADVATLATVDTRLTTDMSAVRGDVHRLMMREQAAVSSSDTDLVVVGSVAAGATVLGGVGLSLLFADRVVRRLRRLGDATEALAGGRPPGPLPAGGDEIGRLGRQLAETAALLRQHEDAREQAWANLDAIMAASPLVSLRYDTARRAVVYASPNIATTFGVSVEAVMADPRALVDLLHPDDVDWLARQIHREATAVGPHLPSEHHIRFRRQDGGDWGEAQVIVTTVDDAGDQPDGRNVVAYFVDVTERLRTERAADQRRHLLESIFDASPDIIVVRDETDAVVLASRQAVELAGTGLGTDATTLPGAEGAAPALEEAAAALHDRLTETNRRDLADLVRRCRQGDDTAEPLVVTATGADGVVRVLETRARPVVADDGRITGTVTVSRDITDRVRLEESLRRASESAEAASTAKSEFLSRMSHELRTPLNAVLGFAQLLELDDLAPEQADFVDQIQRAGQHLLSLINEVLDISRIETGHISLSVEPVPVDNLMAEVAALLTPVAEPSRIQLQLATEATMGVHVLGDRQRLLQVLLNLGSNAVKYNRPDGLVVFHTTREPDGWVRFAVTDTGPGIPPERRTELFVPFSRLGAERSDVEGTGVGLALSKHLVELMGGTIGVTSDPGRGSTFWLELRQTDPGRPFDHNGFDDEGFDDDRSSGRRPADRRPRDHRSAGGGPPAPAIPARVTMAGGTPATTRAGGQAVAGPAEAVDEPDAGTTDVPDVLELPLVVLHVEDNESNATLVAQVLARRSGVQLLYASQARVGLQLASRHRPDLILLDLHLPDLPGDEFLHRLRADPAIAGIRVVAVSADATPARIRRMLGLGVEAYLTKPIDVPALLRLVDLVRLGRPVAQDLSTHHRAPGRRPTRPGGGDGDPGTAAGDPAVAGTPDLRTEAKTEKAGPMP